MKINGSILVVDDNEDVLLAARLLLQQYFASIRCTRKPTELPILLSEQSYDVILLDMNFTNNATSGKEGFHWLEQILSIDPDAVVVLITAYGDIAKAVKAMRQGATDFVLKPWENERLVATMTTAINLRRSKAEVTRLESGQKQLSADIDAPFHEMIGKCEQMRLVFSTIEKVAQTDVNVLVLGENGTGKELVARALHRMSKRREKLFIGVDMGAIAQNLFESELFGHEKGAFTDAQDARVGRFEVASGGTLFLDEISNLDFPLQAKLLRVLETKQLMRLGSNKPISIDIRVISATNAEIYQLIEINSFRQDLLYRLNTVEIRLPPLRERGDDIGLLAEHFLKFFCRKYQKHQMSMGESAMQKLKVYHWPGNVRELSHCIERVVILSEKQQLYGEDFHFEPHSQDTILDSYNLAAVEKRVIGAVLKKHGGNISRAAVELGLTRAALYRRMDKHDL